ncbi:hypothetical protein ACFJYC_03825 [Enterococcus faecalis]|nr:hypothetical protein [Enterococcus faecalis]
MKQKIEINKTIEEIEKLGEITSSNELMKRSLKKFCSINNLKNNKKLYCILAIISFVMTILLCFQNDKMNHVITIVSYMNDLFLGLLGIVFAGYALFQASLSDRLLKLMVIKSKKKHSGDTSFKYTELNESFFSLMCVYIAVIFLNVLNFMVLNNGERLITWLYIHCQLILYVYFFFYSLCILSALLELKFFVFNLYSLINTSVANEILYSVKTELSKPNGNNNEKEDHK